MNDTLEINTKFYTSDFPRINPVEKEWWIEQLLSGKYKQGKGFLKALDGSFCCLGVYCEAKGIPKIQTEGYRQTDANESVLGEIWQYGHLQQYASSAVIPHNHGIPLAEEQDPNACVEYGPFTGDEWLFSSIPQGPTEYGALGQGVRKQWALPGLNDTGLTFPQIADIIRYFL